MGWGDRNFWLDSKIFIFLRGLKLVACSFQSNSFLNCWNMLDMRGWGGCTEERLVDTMTEVRFTNIFTRFLNGEPGQRPR